MRRQYLRDRYFEFRHHLRSYLSGRDAFAGGYGLLQATTLVHRRGGDHSVFVRKSLHVANFAFG